MNLFCAAKLLKLLGTRSQKASAPGDPMADWYATCTTVSGEDVIAAVLLKFRFCVLLPDEGKDRWANLGQQLTQRVRETLQEYPVSQGLIDLYLPADTAFALGVPEGRTVTKLNAVVTRLNKLAPQHPDLKDLQHALNDELVVASDVYGIPSKDLVEQLVHDYAPPVQALELEISLEHEGNTVRRTLLVSPEVSFLFLHRYLLQAFHWGDDHLYAFTLPASKHRRLPVRILDSSADIAAPSEEEDTVLDKDAILGDYLQVGDTFRYTYDFTADWEHTIRVTRVVPTPGLDLPLCTFCEGVAPLEGTAVNFSDLGRMFAPPGTYPKYDTAELITQQLRMYSRIRWNKGT